MPRPTVYMDDDLLGEIDDQVTQSDSWDNRSEYVRYAIRQALQRDMGRA